MILTNDWIDQSVCSVPARNIFANNTDTARAGPGAVPGAGPGAGPDAGPGAGPCAGASQNIHQEHTD